MKQTIDAKNDKSERKDDRPMSGYAGARTMAMAEAAGVTHAMLHDWQMSDDKREPTKEQLILEAAEREFLLKGYDGARTMAIAEAAGVTHAMLHYYFRTKERLFNCIVDSKMQTMGKMLLAAFGDERLPLLDRIRNGVERHFDFVVANPDLPRFFINEIYVRPDRLNLFRHNIEKIAAPLFAKLQRQLDESAERGETERIDVRMLVLDLMSVNIFVFIAYPLVESVFGDFAADRARFLALRKAESVEIILQRIKKHTI